MTILVGKKDTPKSHLCLSFSYWTMKTMDAKNCIVSVPSAGEGKDGPHTPVQGETCLQKTLWPPVSQPATETGTETTMTGRPTPWPKPLSYASLLVPFIQAQISYQDPGGQTLISLDTSVPLPEVIMLSLICPLFFSFVALLGHWWPMSLELSVVLTLTINPTNTESLVCDSHCITISSV